MSRTKVQNKGETTKKEPVKFPSNSAKTNGSNSSLNPFEKASKLSQDELKEQAEKYKRIGTNYYIYTDILTAKKKKVKILKRWTKLTIKDDHGSKIFEHIEKFIDFVNIPDNTDQYKRNFGGCFNLYEPIPHKPEPGEWKITEYFLKHIFGNYYDVGLDYLQIIYLQPTQNLPILCLVSKEQKTGKTTFLKWLSNIYGDNSVTLGNEDFGNKFNTHWISKLIIGIDETAIDKKLVKEQLKRYATSDTILEEKKGIDKIRRDFIGKLILLSNNENNFIQMDEEDNRFFVLKVPTVEREDPDINIKLEKEIPAFLHHIVNRKLEHPKKSRLWFSPELYITNSFQRVVKNTKTIIEKALSDYLADLADNIRSMDDSGEANSINIVPARIAEAINPMIRGINGLNIKIGDILKDTWGLTPTEKPERYQYPYFDFTDPHHLTEERERVIRFNSQTGKFYKIPFDLIDEKRDE